MTGTADSIDRGHPIRVGLSRIADELKTVRDQPAWSMDPAETREALVEATRLDAQVVRARGPARRPRPDRRGRGRLGCHVDGELVGARHPADPGQLRTGRPGSRPRWASEVFEPVRVALAEGRLLVDQAQVIIAAVQALPEDVDAAIRDDALATLIGYAVHHDAKALRILGRRILDVVAPEVGEAHEVKVLEREEREAEAAAVFRMHEDGHGKAHGRFTIPAHVAAQLRQLLLAIAAPKHRASVDGRAPAPGRLSARRLGEAFCELVMGYPTAHAPQAGGTSATVVVTMTLETLMGGLKAAQLDTGHRISPGLARRLACRAGIIPAVLGGQSQVLDLGRRTRFHTEPQRIALAIEQGGCTAEGCDWPPGMCHAHHDKPWSSGGDTSVKNGRLLCPRHHTRAHDPTYTTTTITGGKVRFHRRT